jgi:hypothetical protein
MAGSKDPAVFVLGDRLACNHAAVAEPRLGYGGATGATQKLVSTCTSVLIGLG